MLFFGAISDDFALRSRISPEWNKSGELWSTNGEKQDRSLDPLTIDFSERFLSRWERFHLKFSHQ